MNKGAFWASVEKGVQLLSELGLNKDTNYHKVFDYTPECKVYSRSEDYDFIFNSLINNCDYDVMLFDGSMLQFDYKSASDIRMVYIQYPRVYESFEEFLAVLKITFSDDELYELKEAFDSDYRQYLSEKPRLLSPTYFRYDLDAKNRQNNENIHAYAHLHVGLNNSIRIPVGIDLNPITFILFILRHVYYDRWIEAIRKGQIKQEYLDCKRQCLRLDANVWTDEEQKTLFLG